jgi:integrase
LLKLKQGLSWKTVKHIGTVLGTLLGTAEVWDYIEDNPVRKTKLPRRGARPERKVLAPEQLRLLLAALPEPSCSLVWLVVLTGLRIGELLALRWRDVDLENGVLRVRQTLYEGSFRRSQDAYKPARPLSYSHTHRPLRRVLPSLWSACQKLFCDR